MLLLDSDILIDILRGRPNALAWSASTENETIGMTVFSELELLAGCRDLAAQAVVERFVARCVVFYPSAQALRNGVEIYKSLRLSSGIGANDALIAQTALELNMALHTFNTKHYRHVPGFITIQPYTR